MRYASASLLVVAAAAASMVAAQNTDSAPFGPLTTNNGVSACVQFGSCTNGQSYATTETQAAPVTAPASSVNYAYPTNAQESSNYISNLAHTGAEAAYSSRVAAGQGSNGQGNGATSAVDTARVIAGQAPATVTASSRQAADGSHRLNVNMQGLWTVAAAVAGVALGGAFVL